MKLPSPLYDAADTGSGASAVAAPTDAGSLLYGSDKPADAPAGDAAKADDSAKNVASADAVAKPEGESDKAKDGDKPADKPAEKMPEQLAAEVPEDGKYEFALPEGVDFDAEAAELAMPILKEAGFTRAEANKAADAYAKMQAKAQDALAKSWEKTQLDWQGAAKSDPEYGGDKFDVSLKTANLALDKLGTPELKEYLKASGAGNNPEIIRLMVKIGNAISDDKPVSTDSNRGAQEDVHPSTILYS